MGLEVEISTPAAHFHQLHRKLLEASKDEIVMLKRAWEISEDEFELVERIDGDAPGAFGEVRFGQQG